MSDQAAHIVPPGVRIATAGHDRAWPVRIELLAAALVTAFVIALHVRHFTCAGPLWRDEISTARIPEGPTWGEWYRNKIYNDSSPALWDGVVWAWTRTELGRSDVGLRALGLLVGLGTVGALWWNGRLLGARTPVASLVLLELNGMVACYGDSVRTYGPGILAGLVCSGAVFTLARATGRRQTRLAFAGALLASLVAVHINFFDCAWLLAACLAGAAVCAARRRWGRAIAIVGIGGVAAASLGVYAGLLRTRASMGTMYDYPNPLSAVVAATHLALGQVPVGKGDGVDAIWCATAIVALLVGVVGWFRRRQDGALFGAVLLVAGVVAYLGVLWRLRDSLAGFHYLVLFALVATSVDGLLAVVARPGLRLGIVLIACGAAIAWAGAAWRCAGVRMSNVDRVAERLATVTKPGDVVVVDPWWMGSAVARYYHGPANVLTVPPVSDLRVQRFDLVLPAFGDPHAVDPVVAHLVDATRAGHRVWFVMHPVFTLAADPRTPLPQPTADWREIDYYKLWTRQIAIALERDCGVRRVNVIDLGDADDVSPFEHLQLVEPTP